MFTKLRVKNFKAWGETLPVEATDLVDLGSWKDVIHEHRSDGRMEFERSQRGEKGY